MDNINVTTQTTNKLIDAYCRLENHYKNLQCAKRVAVNPLVARMRDNELIRTVNQMKLIENELDYRDSVGRRLVDSCATGMA